MQKYFFTLLGVLIMSTALSAQAIGLRAGVNSTNANFGVDGISVSFDSQTNFLFGAFVDLPLGTGSKFMLSPEISYVGRGYGTSFDLIGSTSLDVTFNYLDVGVLAKYLFVDNGAVGIYAAAGPVWGYALNGEIDNDGMVEDLEFNDEDGFNRANLQFALAGGINIGRRFFAEVRYMTGISSFAEDEADEEVKSRWSSIGINAGVRFPLAGN